MSGALGAGSFVDDGRFSPSILVGEVGVTFGTPERSRPAPAGDRMAASDHDLELVIRASMGSLRQERIALSVKAEEELLAIVGSLRVAGELTVSLEPGGSAPTTVVPPENGSGEAATLSVLAALVACFEGSPSPACDRVREFAHCTDDPMACARRIRKERLNAPVPTTTTTPAPAATAPAPPDRATARNEATVMLTRSGEERLRLIREIGDLDCALAVLEAWSRQLEAVAKPPAPTASPAPVSTELAPSVTTFMGLEPLRARCGGPCAGDRVHRLELGLRGKCVRPLNERAAIAASMDLGYVSGDLGGLSGSDRLSVEALVSGLLGPPAEGLSGGFFGSAGLGWRWAPYLRFEDPKAGAHRLVGYAEVGHSDLGSQVIRPVLAFWLDRPLGTGPARDRAALLARVRFR